jgi:hypothetical protein
MDPELEEIIDNINIIQKMEVFLSVEVEWILNNALLNHKEDITYLTSEGLSQLICPFTFILCIL